MQNGNYLHSNFVGDLAYLDNALKGFAQYPFYLGILSKPEENINDGSSESYQIIARKNQILPDKDLLKRGKKVAFEELLEFKNHMAYTLI